MIYLKFWDQNDVAVVVDIVVVAVVRNASNIVIINLS